MLRPYPLMLANYQVSVKRGNLRLEPLDQGLMLWIGPIYYWIPQAEFVALVRRALGPPSPAAG